MSELESVICIAAIVVIIFFFYYFIQIAYVVEVHGQEFDPCFVDNDMFQRICDQQEIDRVLEQLLERAKEWNNKK